MRYLPLLLIVGLSCSSQIKPPKSWRVGPELDEISGLGFRESVVFAHNDSGDGPYLYRLPMGAKVDNRQELDAGAYDYEDLTQDPAGNWYLGDFGDNFLRRDDLAIYRYSPVNGETDTIQFHYALPQTEAYPVNSENRRYHNCEAMVYQKGYLHLFTKASGGGRGRFWAYHYRLAAEPGYQEA